MNFLNIGMPVTIVETTQEALERGVATVRRNYENTAKRGRLSLDEVARRMALLTPTLSLDALADSDLVRRRCPLLAEAAAGVGHYAIRQRGTLGGSLAHADPAAQLPLVAVVLGAQIEVASRRGRRRLPAAEFFLSVMTTALAADELIVAVCFPALAAREGTAFRLFSRRHGDFALVSVAASVRLGGGRVECLRLGVGGVQSVPALLGELATRQRGRAADGAWVEEVAAAARAAVQAEDDERIPELYRRELVEVLVARALAAALERASGAP